jgi:Kef-type K+ transport system membrane component KefB
MEPIFRDLLILMVVVWSVAVLLRKIGLPTIMGELVILTTFALDILTPIGLKGCAIMLNRPADEPGR